MGHEQDSHCYELGRGASNFAPLQTVDRGSNIPQGSTDNYQSYSSNHSANSCCSNVKLATYDGKEDWDSFFVPFEQVARRHGWTDSERVDKLHEHLRGAAIRYMCSLSEHVREDYSLLVEQLTQRFGQKDPPTAVRRRLGELGQNKESSAEFVEGVRRLITLAYPGVELELQDQLAVDLFLKELRIQKVVYVIMNKDPTTLVEPQKLVEAHEHNYQATLGRDPEAKGRAQRIAWADQSVDSGEDDVPAASQQVQMLSYATTEQLQAVLEKVDKLHLTLDNVVTRGNSPLDSSGQGGRPDSSHGDWGKKYSTSATEPYWEDQVQITKSYCKRRMLLLRRGGALLSQVSTVFQSRPVPGKLMRARSSGPDLADNTSGHSTQAATPSPNIQLL
ncbi:hypothetical protein EOD39_5080 [Acipenser ruthenus]|uniref:Retrotransposon gag domain-containing protein n=1 Tax=Acipenser ruthenus TaxID=7906 RepID=A0A444UFJ6_ACIRT|nr:hypothetical protein EOD39_5080 [Acipenser ruthenus]